MHLMADYYRNHDLKLIYFKNLLGVYLDLAIFFKLFMKTITI